MKKKLFSLLVFSVILAFALSPVDAAVRKGPYLIYEGINTEMTVLWQLDSTEACTIEWGLDTSYSLDSFPTTEYDSDHQHAHTIPGLSPGTKYYYQVTDSALGLIGSGSFNTAPLDSATSTKLLVFGDTRADAGLVPSAYDSVCQALNSFINPNPDYQTLILHAGDWINSDTEYDWETMFFNRSLSNALDFHKILPINGCRGNHEGGGTVYNKYYPYPYYGSFYWSFNYGPVLVVVIDQYTSYTSGSTQYNWCLNELLTTDRKWKFILFHEPAWSADGGHGSNTTAQNFINSLRADGAEIDIVFGGHNHYYARCLVDGIQHITTGGGGAPLRDVGGTPAYVVAAESVLQFCEIDIQDDQLDYVARRVDGSVLDTFTLNNNPPEISFTDTTPDDGETITKSQVQIDAVIIETDLAEVTFQWDETDYTPYDSSLVLMYNFNNVAALGENFTPPLLIRDLSRNGKDAVGGLTDIPSFGASGGLFDGSYYFDGVNDSIVVADADGSLAPGAGDFAIALWLQPWGNTDADILNKTSGTGYKLEHSPGGFNKISLTFDTDGIDTTISSVNSYADGMWHFVVAQRVGDQAELWIDGILNGTATVTGSITNSADLILGSNAAQSGEYYQGDLDELRIYKRSFNANEIQFLYDSNLSKYLGYVGGPTEWTLKVFRAGLMERDYTYRVSAMNAAFYTGSDQRTVWVDLPNPPDVTLVSPANGSQLNTTTVTFTVDAVDPVVDLQKAELYVGTAGQTLTFSGPTQMEDAQIDATYPNDNFGSADSINVDGENPHSHAVIKFPNLIGTDQDQVPPGTTIESATLQVNCTNLGSMMQVYRLTSDWSEDTVTWNNPWTTLGGDYDPAVVVDGDCTATGLRTIDITTFVQAWIDGTNNYGILLTDTDRDGVDFYSSESGNPPLLTVVYAGDWQKVGATEFLVGDSDTATFTNISLNDETDYIWNCLVTNIEEVSSWAVSNFTLSIDGQTPDVPVLVGPADGVTGVPIPATLEVTVTDPQPEDLLEVSFYGRPAISAEEDFTLVVLPDTQYYSLNNPAIFDDQTQWIVDNAVADNIVFVTHEGDIVQSNDSVEQEWINARNSMSILDPGLVHLADPTEYDPFVPYGMTLGNHDTPGAFYNYYFPTTRYEGLGWYGGHFDSSNDNNRYQLISAGGMDLLMLHLEYNPGSTIDDPIIAWADGILKAYPDRMAIITTHAFMDTNTSHLGEGAGIWNVLVQGNDNVYFVLCGHVSGEATRTDLVNGRNVHQLLADYQNRNNGDGWLRILRFAPPENKVYVETYTPYLDSYETDTNSQFTLDVPLNRFELLGTNDDVVSGTGTNTSLPWTGLAEEGEYEWYVTVTDPTDRTSFGPVWSFNTVTRKAHNPSPADGATDVVLDADLSWSAGLDAVSHDVYFGTDVGNLILVSAEQTTTTYEPGTLEQDTTYYWAIDEHDSGVGVTAGNIWSFTTLNMKATNPNPANGATNVSVNADLSWSAGADAVSHDVYFGTDVGNMTLVSDKQATTTYEPGILQQDTTYYWAIDEYDSGDGFTAGDIWSFTTTPPSVAYTEDFESGFTLGQTVGSHSDWFDGGAGPVVTSGNGIGGSVGLVPSGTIFTWTAHPFVWTEVNKVIIGMDFQTDGSGYFDDDRIGWMISNTSTGSSDIFGVQLDPGGSGYNIEGYWDGSTADRRPSIVDLPNLSANAWYHLRAEFTRLTDTSAGINVELWSLDAGGNPVALIVDGSIADTNELGADAPHSKYFPTTNLWPGYKNHTGVAGAVDNAYFEEVPIEAVPPVISNVQASGITGVIATITWTTDKPSNSAVRYGETTAMGSELSDVALVTSHSLTLTGLSPDTLYYYEVESTDADAGTTIDNNGGVYYSFTTAAPPGQSSAPSPANAATDVSIDADLSWTPGSNTTSHDVYFGIDPDPRVNTVVNQSGTIFDPGTLNPSVTYYWVIDEVGPGGTTAGSIWSFTTVAAPGQASILSPANTAIDVSIDADLSWTAGSNTTSHNVYFGTDLDPRVNPVVNQPETTFDPGTLNLSETYYWAIDEIGPGGTTAGSIWSFTTEVDSENPVIASPTGDTSSTTGDPVTIQATVTDNDDVASATVYYTPIGGSETSVPMTAEGASDVWSVLIPVAIDKVGDITYYLTAQDPTGNSATTGTYTITVTDDDTSSISGATGDTTATTHGTVPISATITDNIDVTGATLHYTPVGGSETSISMDEGTNDLWSASVPAGSLEGDITYYITAEDAVPNTATDPPTGYYTITVSAPGPTTLFSDGFESGDLATGGWSDNGSVDVKEPAAYEGVYGVQIGGTASIEKSISTVGFTDIHVKYARKTKGMDSGEPLTVEWYDGTTWISIESTTATDWAQQDFALAAEAEDNAAFRIRFSTSANKTNEYAAVDSVEIIGTITAPDLNPPMPNPATFASPPTAISDTEITMTATTGTDVSGPVEYLFTETSGNPGGTSSGWTTNPVYTDTGLTPETQYTYTVQMRDAVEPVPNVGTASAPASATTDPAPNLPPTFTVDPINKIDASEDTAYSSTLADDASDPESDPMTFSKVSGPVWLTVAANGALSGTPTNSDVGLNVFTVKVDATGGSDTATLNITVINVNDAPTWNSDPVNEMAATEDSTYSSTLADDATDMDAGDTLTYSKVSGPAWLTVATNGALSGTPTNSDVGDNSWIVSVSDGIAAPVQATLTITVNNTNDAPTFTVDPINKTDATEDTAYSDTIAGSATDEDADDTLTYSKVSGPAWLSVSADGTLSGTPTNSDVGANAFGVQVSDGNGGTDTATMNLTVVNVNDAPTFTVDPITKPNATVDAAYSDSLSGSATDVDASDTLTYSKVSGPAWLTVAANGALSGTPGAGDVGANSWTIEVSDGNDGTDTATLNITVDETPNLPPTFTVDPVNEIDATEDTAYSSTLADDASDPESDPMTFSKVSGPAWLSVATDGSLSGTPGNSDVGANAFTIQVDATGGSDTATLNITVINVNDVPTWNSDPVNEMAATEDSAYSSTLADDATDMDVGDTLTYSKVSGPAWLTVSANGALSGTPTNSDVGDNSWTVSVSDGIAAPVQATLTIMVNNTNDAPTFTVDPINKADATEDVAYSDTLAGSATDEDASDTLTYSKVSGPAWLTVAANGTLSGMPTNSDVGANAFSVQVSDGNGGTDTATLNITVINTNDPPTITSTAVTDATENSLYSYDVEASDPDIGDTLTFSLTTAPAGMTIDSASGLIQWTPTSEQVGNNSVAVSVTDGELSDTQSFTVTVTDQPQSTIYVASMVEQPFISAGRNIKAVVGVTINILEAGATVSGDWYLNDSLIASGTSGITDAAGYTEIVSVPEKAKSGDVFRFEIIDVTLSGYTYDSSSNVMEIITITVL